MTPQERQKAVHDFRLAMRRRLYGEAGALLAGPLEALITPEAELARAEIFLWRYDTEAAAAALRRLREREQWGRRAETLDQRLSELVTAPPRRRPFRHIAVTGMSYSGTTLLSALLGSLPGAFNAGETSNLARNLPCASCNGPCRVFDTRFCAGIDSQRDRYAAIAEQARTDLLITSDKGPQFLLRAAPRREFDMVVVFKPPLAAWDSHLRTTRYLSQLGLAPAQRTLEQYLADWTTRHLMLLRGMNPRGRVIAISWEAFSTAPEAHLGRLCELLALVPQHDPLALRPDQHVSSGNPVVIREGLKRDRAAVYPPREPDVSPADQAAIEAHTEAPYAHALLQERYRQDFAGA